MDMSWSELFNSTFLTNVLLGMIFLQLVSGFKVNRD